MAGEIVASYVAKENLLLRRFLVNVRNGTENNERNGTESNHCGESLPKDNMETENSIQDSVHPSLSESYQAEHNNDHSNYYPTNVGCGPTVCGESEELRMQCSPVKCKLKQLKVH